MEDLFWADTTAREIIEREKKLNRGIKNFRTESGLGASGIPHLGSASDPIRSYGIALALEDAGMKSELIAFSDDRDGLRKVPLDFPNSLEKEIGKPVTDIKDPFNCHESYGEHMTSLLQDALDKIGLKYTLMSGAETYREGLLNQQIETLLINSDKVKKIIKDMLGQDLTTVYFPVCEKCGRIYTTRVVKVLPKEHKVVYKCDQEFLGTNKNTGKEIIAKGCGCQGEASYFNGNGKLSWKCEFAARWDALKIVFEALGKELIDSVKVNDEIDRQLLKFEPPVHLVYELFLEKGGKKMSKSVGNVFTPQDWLRYGSPESIRLLMYKRFVGTREISERDIKVYMDEVDRLERIYFGRELVGNEKELKHLKRLFEYVHFLNPPGAENMKVPYDVLVNLIKVLPINFEKKFETVKYLLRQTGHIEELSKEGEKQLRKRVEYVSNWLEVMGAEKPKIVKISENDKKVLAEIQAVLKKKPSGDEFLSKVFEISKKNNVSDKNVFKILYGIILGIDKGPRISHLVDTLGPEMIYNKIKETIG